MVLVRDLIELHNLFTVYNTFIISRCADRRSSGVLFVFDSHTRLQDAVYALLMARFQRCIAASQPVFNNAGCASVCTTCVCPYVIPRHDAAAISRFMAADAGGPDAIAGPHISWPCRRTVPVDRGESFKQTITDTQIK